MPKGPETKVPYISYAALRFEGGLYLGPLAEGHAGIRKRIARIKKIEDLWRIDGAAGFMTNERKILSRSAAFLVAEKAGQVVPNSESAKNRVLYSDDVRPPLSRSEN